MGSPVLVAVAFPRPISREDFDLKVGVSAALLATAFEELFKVIDVLAVAVGEGRQDPLATGVPERRPVGGSGPPIGASPPQRVSDLVGCESGRAQLSDHYGSGVGG